MKKLILAIALVAIISVLTINIAKAEEPAPANNGTPLFQLLAAQCLTVGYSAWGPCLTGFNVQVRQIVYRPGNCVSSTRNQVETTRFCNSQNYFGDSIR